MRLHYRKIGVGEPLIILHGLFGSSDNWQTLGKTFSERYSVYLPDLRNHGISPHSDVFDYGAMAEDIMELMETEKIDHASILGHSMGGKVAMRLAFRHSERIRKLIVVDIAPRYYAPHHHQIFKGFRSVDLASIASRKEADEQIRKHIADLGIRQFLLKNLTRDKDGAFRWKLNLDIIEQNIKEVGKSVACKVRYEGETLFIAGSKSSYIRSVDHEAIFRLFPKSRISCIEGAGHWVHAEKPEALSQMVLEFIS